MIGKLSDRMSSGQLSLLTTQVLDVSENSFNSPRKSLQIVLFTTTVFKAIKFLKVAVRYLSGMNMKLLT